MTYAPGRFAAGVDLDLSKNEGNPSATYLLQAVEQQDELIRSYPDTSALRDHLADLHRVDPGQVLVTAGGDDALFRCFLARLGPETTAVATRPTFEMIPVYSEQVGSELVEIEWWEGDFPTSFVVSAAAGADAVFVVSPNNPTGATISGDDLREVSEAAEFVVLDGAYSEFADEDLTPAALDLGNVVVVRTLSKAYGLAGLRVGFALGPADLIQELSSYGSPYPVSSLSAAIASERLRQSQDVTTFVGEIRSERTELAELFDELGVETLPSQGNFILAETKDAEWVTEACAALGVGIRRFPGREILDSWVRITLPGEPDRFARLARTLTTVLAPEALLFDLDGVLVDVSDSYRRSIIETAASFGVTVSGLDIEEAKSNGGANDDWDLTRRLISEGGKKLAYQDVAARFEEIYQGDADAPGLKQNERPLVDPSTWSRMADAMPLGVVTGRPRADAEEVLERFGLLAKTSVLVAREDAPFKPDPAPVRLAMSRLAVDHAWLVGDTPDDIAAAKSAGVLPIGIGVSGAARTLDRTTDIEELLP
jgi:histidinol-phosphate aminotransferase